MSIKATVAIVLQVCPCWLSVMKMFAPGCEQGVLLLGEQPPGFFRKRGLSPSRKERNKMAFTARPARHRMKSNSSDEQGLTSDKGPAVSFSYREIFYLGLESQSNVYCCTKLRKSVTDDDEKLLVGSLRGTVFCIDYKNAPVNGDYRPIANKVYFTYIPGRESEFGVILESRTPL